MLCSNALGTPPLLDAMKIAVPGTRVAEFLALLAKMAIGSATSLIRSRISLRPLAQVVSKVNAKAPTSSGNQPPSGTLGRFAPKKEPSTRKKTAAIGSAVQIFQRHTAMNSTAIKQVSISIAPVTAMPYALARLEELRKVSTSRIT